MIVPDGATGGAARAPVERPADVSDRVPDTARLEQLLNVRLPDVQVLGRQRNTYTSTAPSEIVECRLPDGRQLTLLCKYFFSDIVAANMRSQSAFNEIRVYTHILDGLPGIPRVYGTWTDEAAGQGFLALEFLSGATRLGKVADPKRALLAATRWLGQFHRWSVPAVTNPQLIFLRRFDERYFRTCLQTSLQVLESRDGAPSWLREVDSTFDSWWAVMPERLAIIHAEFYPKNVLIRGNDVFPVDWETAAVGPPEFDLAMLLTNWPDHVVEECLDVYASNLDGPVDRTGLRGRLRIASLLVNLHWLTFSLRGTVARKHRTGAPMWLEQLRRASVAAGMTTSSATTAVASGGSAGG